MADLTQSFTGKGTGIVLPESKALQAQQGLSAIIKEAEQLRYQVYEKNRNEFLKNANIDPAFVFSDSVRKYIQERINSFNTKYGKLAQRYNYNLPDQVRMDMQTEKNLIIAEQQNQQVQYELWKQHRDLVAKNPGTYSVEEFAKATDSFMQNGIYNQSTPAYKPHDFGNALREAYNKANGKIGAYGAESMRPAGKGVQSFHYYTMDEEQYNGLISDIIASDPNARTGLFKEIEQNREEIFRNADKDGNNVLDSGEKENAIIGWVKQKYPRQILQIPPTAIPGYAKSIPSATVAEKATAQTGVQKADLPKTYGQTRKDEEGNMLSEKKTYSQKSFHFPSTATIDNISTQNGTAIDEYGMDDLSAGVIDAQIVLYDPVKKVFLVKSKRPSASTGQPSNALIEVPEINILNHGDIPIKVDGQPEIKTISDYKNYWDSTSIPRETQTPKTEQTITDLSSIF